MSENEVAALIRSAIVVNEMPSGAMNVSCGMLHGDGDPLEIDVTHKDGLFCIRDDSLLWRVDMWGESIDTPECEKLISLFGAELKQGEGLVMENIKPEDLGYEVMSFFHLISCLERSARRRRVGHR